MPRDENMIAALKRERAGYVARGMDGRVAEVDEQLSHYGYTPAEDTDDNGAPKGRTTPEGAKQTADGQGSQSGAATDAQKTGTETAKQTTSGKSTQTAAQKRAGGGKD